MEQITALFKDRIDAGRALARPLSAYAGRNDVVVLALPRGGVPVAFEVARALKAPLDIFLVRKLGVPGHEELAMGAIAANGVRVINQDVVRILDIPDELIEIAAAREQEELERQEKLYRGNRPRATIRGRIVILVDDGLATGASMRAAVAALRHQDPARIIVAVPTGAPETCAAFEDEVEEVICAETPHPFYGVGAWYEDFSQTSDAEVYDLLKRAAGNRRPG